MCLWLGADIKLIVGIISLVGVICTVCVTALNNINTNKLTKELGEQTRKLTKELGEQTHKLTKELGEKNLKALEQRRYIDAISSERVKWINTMRDRFSEYIKLVHIQMNDFDKWKSHGDKDIDEDVLRKRYFEITSVNNQINFLLNQTEPIVKKLVKRQSELTRELSLPEDISEFNYRKLQNITEDLGYFYQVVLKAEWKRVKEEIKKGEEIDDDGMNNIYLSAAKKLSEEFYNKHLIELES
ncbi:hypothetical protein COM08_11995 [Bacillus wiedmannii]|nr:hypothetical protein COM08_11995 [Bacillus wiedmannii]